MTKDTRMLAIVALGGAAVYVVLRKMNPQPVASSPLVLNSSANPGSPPILTLPTGLPSWASAGGAPSVDGSDVSTDLSCDGMATVTAPPAPLPSSALPFYGIDTTLIGSAQ